MRPLYIITFGMALSFIIGNLSANTDPFAPAPKTEAELQKELIKRDVLTIRMIIEKDGKEVGSCTAHVSERDAGENRVLCAGTIRASESLYWRIHVDAELDQFNNCSINVDVDDLNLIQKKNDTEIAPVRIFSINQQSKGLGNYLCGVVQGMTLRVVIAKAEQAEPSNGDKPSN